MRAAAYGGSSLEGMYETHVEVARGGVGMTTLAYASVSKDGRTFASQLVLTRLSASERIWLKKMVDGVHAAGAAVSIQLTHAGGFASSHVIGARQKAPSATFSPANMSFSEEMSTIDLDRVVNDFCTAASVAVSELGFDCLEIHCGHGYLLSQFLTPARNLRQSNDSGGPDGYTTFPLRVIHEVRLRVGPTVPIVVKFNVNDGFAGGLKFDQHVLKFVRELVSSGDVDLLVPSCGYVDQNGFHMLRGTVPYWNMFINMPNWIEKFAMLFCGRCLVPTIPFEHDFLKDYGLNILKEVNMMNNNEKKMKTKKKVHVALLGGVRTWSGMERAVTDGFAVVQTARTLIRQPDFVRLIEKELETSKEEPQDVISKCTQCNECVIATLKEGSTMRCVLRSKTAGDFIDIEDLSMPT